MTIKSDFYVQFVLIFLKALSFRLSEIVKFNTNRQKSHPSRSKKAQTIRTIYKQEKRYFSALRFISIFAATQTRQKLEKLAGEKSRHYLQRLPAIFAACSN